MATTSVKKPSSFVEVVRTNSDNGLELTKRKKSTTVLVVMQTVEVDGRLEKVQLHSMHIRILSIIHILTTREICDISAYI